MSQDERLAVSLGERSYDIVVGSGLLARAGSELVKFSSSVETLSLIVAVVLLIGYAGGLWFSLVSHRDLFNPPDEPDEGGEREPWSIKRSVILLAIAGIVLGAVMGAHVAKVVLPGGSHSPYAPLVGLAGAPPKVRAWEPA